MNFAASNEASRLIIYTLRKDTMSKNIKIVSEEANKK